MALGLKLLFWTFVVAWALVYASFYPLVNFLWTCNSGLILTAVALAFNEHRLTLSVCLILVALPDFAWTLDVTVAAITGTHPTGATAYMFDPEIPKLVRLFSFEHVLLTPVIVFFLWSRGYDRRALPLAALLVLMLYYITYWLAEPATQVNWVWGPFGQQQSLFDPALYPLFAALVFSLVFLLPGHFLASWLLQQGRGNR